MQECWEFPSSTKIFSYSSSSAAADFLTRTLRVSSPPNFEISRKRVSGELDWELSAVNFDWFSSMLGRRMSVSNEIQIGRLG